MIEKSKTTSESQPADISSSTTGDDDSRPESIANSSVSEKSYVFVGSASTVSDRSSPIPIAANALTMKQKDDKRAKKCPYPGCSKVCLFHILIELANINHQKFVRDTTLEVGHSYNHK